MFGLVSEVRFNELRDKYNRLQRRLDDCEKIETRNKELANENYSLRSQLVEVNKQIREQTEADLFFVSAKIQKKLLDGEPKQNVAELGLQQLAYQVAYQNQLVQMQAPSQSSFLSGLGLGAWFNQR